MILFPLLSPLQHLFAVGEVVCFVSMRSLVPVGQVYFAA